MNNITNEQALNNLYVASRLAPLNAEQHEVLRQSAEKLAEAIKVTEAEKEEVKNE